MNKPVISILSMLIGLAAGVLLGQAFVGQTPPGPVVSDSEDFFYQLNDSMMVRHTVSVTEGRLNHTVDTIVIQMR